MKLVYKFFAALLCTSILIIALMIGIMQYFASEYFADYVAKTEMTRLTSIWDVLKAEYRRHNTWDHIRDNRLLWDQIIREHQPEDSEEEPLPHRGPPPAGMPRYEDPTKSLPPPAPLISRRLTLYDGQKRFVIGRSDLPENQGLREIVVEGRTVGWLGLSRKKILTDPLQLHFIYEQTRAFLLIGSGILIFAAVIAFVLSRHLLHPIQQIMAGAHALASRRFDTRIDVHSSDELGTLAADFNNTAATLERYEFMRRQWIADVSHELRTPLAVLRGEIEAILDGVRDMHRETLESVHAEVMLLSKIIDDLHTLTITESEALTMTKEPVDVLTIAANILKVFQPRFSERGIEVQNDMVMNGGGTVMGDPDRLAQVFSNIYENSLRYTDSPGKVHIYSEKRDDSLLLRVEDTAPGVSDSAIPFIFDRLYRVDRSRSRKKGGSGLGMAIIKAIVDGHGGKIKASSSQLGGLQIEIALPLVKNG
jgi:two-component system, OmpR family, sensor histidine kinase BaeS